MILTPEQINELVDRLKPLGCTTYDSPFVDNVSILYKYNLCVFEYHKGMNGYSLIQTSPASILTESNIWSTHNYQLHYFNNSTFDIDVIEKVVQKFIGALEKQEKEEKVRKKKKDLEKDFEEVN
jgi:hypothetical protein